MPNTPFVDEPEVSAANEYLADTRQFGGFLKQGNIYSVDGTIFVSINGSTKFTLEQGDTWPLDSHDKIAVSSIKITTASVTPLTVRLNFSLYSPGELTALGIPIEFTDFY